MIIAIAVTAALAIFIVMYVLFQVFYQKQRVIRNRLHSLRGKEQVPADMYWQQQMNRSLFERIFQPLADDLAKSISRLTPSSLRRKAEELVELSGGFGGVGMTGFMLLMGACTLVLMLLGLYYAGTYSFAWTKRLLIVLAAFGVGVGLPFFILHQVVGERQEQIRSSMPDVLDLLCVSVQAGLGFDGALGKVTAKMKGPLIEEFDRLLQELRMGVTRRNALQRLAKRCGIQEMHLFTAALIQAERLGVGMAQVLEIQSENIREMRRQRAKEAAAKLPVKILIPTVLFIFPVMFIVVLGPALITVMNTFMK